jgi:hypothetical protein
LRGERGKPLTKKAHGNLAPSPAGLAAPAYGRGDHLLGTVPGIAMPRSLACHSLPDVMIELLSINAQRHKMSHGGSGRAACSITKHIPQLRFDYRFDSTRRDRSRRWLWRLVRQYGSDAPGRKWEDGVTSEPTCASALNDANTKSHAAARPRPWRS